ncbi:MAG: polymer-forming cytoskeletal protein [Tissierellia bacterium]|nr:polymer-forming cytoskeletal protein [Tissierellia bacterium]
MFGKKTDKSYDIDSLIGENIKILGKVEGKGNIRIDGSIEGDIDCKGDVILGETGRVKGNIYCRDLSLGGNVEGNVKSSGKLTLLSTGKLIGDAEVASLIVHEDAFFHGSCKMVEEGGKSQNINVEEKGNRV